MKNIAQLVAFSIPVIALPEWPGLTFVAVVANEPSTMTFLYLKVSLFITLPWSQVESKIGRGFEFTEARGSVSGRIRRRWLVMLKPLNLTAKFTRNRSPTYRVFTLHCNFNSFTDVCARDPQYRARI